MSDVGAEQEDHEWAPAEDEPVAVDITYCNPDAKVVLISSNKVEMKVDAWVMSRQRYVFPAIPGRRAILVCVSTFTCVKWRCVL